jgi:hypothetical protein
MRWFVIENDKWVYSTRDRQKAENFSLDYTVSGKVVSAENITDAEKMVQETEKVAS